MNLKESLIKSYMCYIRWQHFHLLVSNSHQTLQLIMSTYKFVLFLFNPTFLEYIKACLLCSYLVLFSLFSQSCFVEECTLAPAVCPIPPQLCWSNAPVPDMLAPGSRRHPFTRSLQRAPLADSPPWPEPRRALGLPLSALSPPTFLCSVAACIADRSFLVELTLTSLGQINCMLFHILQISEWHISSQDIEQIISFLVQIYGTLIRNRA